MCETDSAWIFYADEALSYALELVYLVEEDVYSEVAKELRKIIVKNSLAFWVLEGYFMILIFFHFLRPLYLSQY